jgi:hypothetical protein
VVSSFYYFSRYDHSPATAQTVVESDRFLAAVDPVELKMSEAHQLAQAGKIDNAVMATKLSEIREKIENFKDVTMSFQDPLMKAVSSLYLNKFESLTRLFDAYLGAASADQAKLQTILRSVQSTSEQAEMGARFLAIKLDAVKNPGLLSAFKSGCA